MSYNCTRSSNGRFLSQEDNIKPGDIFESNSSGKFEIVRKITDVFDETGLHKVDNSKHKYYAIRFLDTGSFAVVNSANIKSGMIRDYWKPTYFGVGSIGGYNIHPKDDKHRYFYATWRKMMSRCYNENDPDYDKYGALGISVEPRWHVFVNFFDDCKYLPNYDKKILFPTNYQIDKDFLQFNIPKENRCYSRETCIFLSKFDNVQIMNRERSRYLGNKYFGIIENFDYKYNYGNITSYSVKLPNFNENGTVLPSLTLANFKTDFAAACFFNYVYPFATRKVIFHDFNILNKIENMIPYDDLINYVSTRKPNDWFNDYPTWEYIASAMEKSVYPKATNLFY